MVTIKKNIIITGQPGIGKTTLIKKLSEELKIYNPIGFYTNEIRKNGIRKGFGLVTLDGGEGLLSYINIKSPYRVGKYRVDVSGFERFINLIPFLNSDSKLIIIDEIGKMECFSARFNRLIWEILNSENLLIATVALKGKGLIEKIKRRDDIILFEITHENRDYLLEEILEKIKKYLSEKS